jgi:hypothetical protein
MKENSSVCIALEIIERQKTNNYCLDSVVFDGIGSVWLEDNVVQLGPSYFVPYVLPRLARD